MRNVLAKVSRQEVGKTNRHARRVAHHSPRERGFIAAQRASHHVGLGRKASPAWH